MQGNNPPEITVPWKQYAESILQHRENNYSSFGINLIRTDKADKADKVDKVDKADKADKALEIAKLLEAGEEAIPAGLYKTTGEYEEKIGEVTSNRDCCLTIALLHLLEPFLKKQPDCNLLLDTLIHMLARADKPLPGLIFTSLPRKTSATAKAHRDQVVSTLDKVFPTINLGHDQNENRRYTKAAAIIALERQFCFGRNKKGVINPTVVIDEIIRGWASRNFRGSANGSNTLIPTDKERCTTFEFHSHPWLAQLLQFAKPKKIPSNEYWVRIFRSRAINELPRDFDEVRWTGLRIYTIYISILIERLSLLDISEMTQHQTSNTDEDLPPTNLPPELAHAIPMAHWEAAALAIDPPAMTFDLMLSSTDSSTEEVMVAYTIENFHLKPNASEFSDSRSIGSISLPDEKDFIGPVMWYDILIVAKLDGHWQVVPVVCEDDPDDPRRTEFIVTNPHKQWSIERLRSAFECASWAYQQNGLGVFMVGALDLEEY